MLERLIKFVKSPFVKNCLTGEWMLNIDVTYVHINKFQGYVSKDLGYVVNSCYVIDPKRMEGLFNAYKFTRKPESIIHRFRNLLNKQRKSYT